MRAPIERQRILAAIIDSECKAWEALSGYKFWMFGYHAARWQNYNMLLGSYEKLQSPFRSLVHLARDKIEAMEDERQTIEIEDLQLPLIGSEGDGA